MKVNSLIIFMAGAAVGFAAASLYFKDKYKTLYQKQSEEEIASMKEYVDKVRELDKEGKLVNSLKYVGKEPETVKVEAEVPAEAVEKSALKNYSELYGGVGIGVAGAMGAAAYEHPSEDDEEEKVENWDDTRRKGKEGRYDPPKIIRADEFDDCPWHDKESLLFYQEDEVLVSDTNNEPVDDVEALIGDALEKYGFAHNDEKCIYVRNFRIGVDYEIVKVFGAYYE